MPRLPWNQSNRSPSVESDRRTGTMSAADDQGESRDPGVASALEGPLPDGRSASEAPPTEAPATLTPPPQLSRQSEALASEQEPEAPSPEPGERVRRRVPHAAGAARIDIGRDPRNDLVLGSPEVALFQASIEREAPNAPWLLTNRDPAGTVTVNGDPVDRRTLADGDVIAIGPYRLEVQAGEIEYFDEATGILLQALDLQQRAGRKIILKDVSLIVQPHEFVAIVGASGSGKTTLLRALSGAHPASGGQVLLNDLPLYANFGALRTKIGYVPQDDIVHTRLTVEQAFGYAASLRLPREMRKQERRARVDEVIHELDLEGQRRTVISHLSGGQRKRVSIGVELLTKPPLFFLDEPTSGLDPATGRHMMQLMRRLARQGRTVIVTTHLTRDIAMCDKVLFLTQGGQMAFFGPPQEALHYFGVQEIEEIYDLLAGERSPDEWAARFRDSEIYRNNIVTPLVREQAATLPDLTRRPAGRPGRRLLSPSSDGWRQFRVLTVRYTATTLRDRKHLAVLLLQAPIIALLLWALFEPGVFTRPQGLTILWWHDNTVTQVIPDPRTGELPGHPGTDVLALSGAGCSAALSGNLEQLSDCHIAAGNGNNQATKVAQLAFLLAATAVWLGTLAAIGEIAKEHAIYARERLVNLRIVPYIGSKFAVLLVLVVLQTVMLLGITAVHIHFPRDVLAGTWLTLFLGGAASVAVALAVSAAVTNPERSIVFAPLLMVPQILLAGGLSPIQDLGAARPLSTLVATRWAFEAAGRVFHVMRIAAVPDQFPYADAMRGEPLSRWLILAGFVLGFGVLATLLQKLKDRR